MRIAEATQSDSTAMKMISFLGFLFLPGTFLSVSQFSTLSRPDTKKTLTRGAGHFQHEFFPF